MQGSLVESFEQLKSAFESMLILARTAQYDEELVAVLEAILLQNKPREVILIEEDVPTHDRVALAWKRAQEAYTTLTTLCESVLESLHDRTAWTKAFMDPQDLRTSCHSSGWSTASLFSTSSTRSRFGTTYSVGSASSYVSNSALIVP
jgi:hypothetical protein